MKYVICFLSLLFLPACGDDAEIISGCTNPDSVNYLSTATVDDGSCRLLRDDYIGNFNVTTSDCLPSGDFYENITFKITADSDNDDGVHLSIGGFTPLTIPIIIPATVSTAGLTLKKEDTFYFQGAVGVTFLNIYDGIEQVGVTMSFSGNLTKMDSNLSGRLTFTALDFPGDQIIGTICDYVLSPS